MFRAIFRGTRKVLKWLFLLTLPFTFLPLFTGSLAGVILAFWDSNHMEATTDKFLHEVKEIMDDWGIGGGVPTFREFQDTHNDFHTMRINSNDWTSKLGFMLPDQYVDMEDLNIPIDKYADLQHLVRNEGAPSCRKLPKESWVFLTYHGFRFFPWDKDFIYAINYAQGDRNLNQTGLFFAQCTGTASFLCGVWHTRSPALVHFIVEDEPLDPNDVEEGLTYSADFANLRPVTARIIEFPLKDAYTGLTLKTFPSEQEQMLSIMTGDRLYEQFDPHEPMDKVMTRFTEYMNSIWDAKGTVLHYVNVVDNAMVDHVTEPLGMERSLQWLHALVFILTSNFVQAFVLMPYKLAMQLVGDFLAAPRRGDWILGDIPEQKSDDDWMSDLFARVASHAAQKASESTGEGMTVTTPQASWNPSISV